MIDRSGYFGLVLCFLLFISQQWLTPSICIYFTLVAYTVKHFFTPLSKSGNNTYSALWVFFETIHHWIFSPFYQDMGCFSTTLIEEACDEGVKLCITCFSTRLFSTPDTCMLNSIIVLKTTKRRK